MRERNEIKKKRINNIIMEENNYMEGRYEANREREGTI